MNFQGEVQFAGYSDSSRSGPRVTFRLAEREDLEQFVGMEGRRFMVAFVEIGDDEKPVDASTTPAVVDETPAAPLGPLAKWCVMRCKEASFQHWCKATDEAGAKAYVLAVIGVESRRQLDFEPFASSFEQLRKNYWHSLHEGQPA